ncbi:unnamed protein product (mitochondrion) [Plasmodiophora brassicae]|uniref:Uncharacterized protein n=1 Tax=Plasmodiophora brassicae TaxID=37360 RepID=A0A3P3YKF3_PLABS|nr:unnamed protein product [Plasmodiophora brassicae]
MNRSAPEVDDGVVLDGVFQQVFVDGDDDRHDTAIEELINSLTGGRRRIMQGRENKMLLLKRIRDAVSNMEPPAPSPPPPPPSLAVRPRPARKVRFRQEPPAKQGPDQPVTGALTSEDDEVAGYTDSEKFHAVPAGFHALHTDSDDESGFSSSGETQQGWCAQPEDPVLPPVPRIAAHLMRHEHEHVITGIRAMSKLLAVSSLTSRNHVGSAYTQLAMNLSRQMYS